MSVNTYPFEHEAPILVRDRGKPKIWYPDFYLPDFHTIIEYFGVEGDPGYERIKRRKQTVYRKNRIPAIYMSPRDLELDWREELLSEIERILVGRISEFQKYRLAHIRSKGLQVASESEGGINHRAKPER